MRDDALPFARILLAGGAIASAVAVAIVVVLAMLGHRHVPVGGLVVDKPGPLGPGLPMLQTAPQADLAVYRAEKAHELGSFGWIDAASSVAHVPIARAMDLLAQRAASAPEAEAPGVSR